MTKCARCGDEIVNNHKCMVTPIGDLCGRCGDDYRSERQEARNAENGRPAILLYLPAELQEELRKQAEGRKGLLSAIAARWMETGRRMEAAEKS